MDRVCALCYGRGHEAKSCSVGNRSGPLAFDPLTPRGNMGEGALPPTRPEVASVFIPETQQMKGDTMELSRSIVIDTKLKPSHSPEMVQSILMTVTKSDFPYALTHMEGTQYLLILSQGADRNQFLLRYAKPLQELGYVTYPWTAAVNGFPLRLKYRIWIELHKVSPQAWTIDYLIPAVSSFGIVLNHGSMTKVGSLEKMVAVIAVEELDTIPHSIKMWIRGIARIIGVKVLSWVEEAVPFTMVIDPTPNQQYFDHVRLENIKAVTGFEVQPKDEGVLTIEFETLLSIWEKMEPGDKKTQIEGILQASPLFENRLKEAAERASNSRKQSEAVPHISGTKDPKKWKGKEILEGSSSVGKGGDPKPRNQSTGSRSSQHAKVNPPEKGSASVPVHGPTSFQTPKARTSQQVSSESHQANTGHINNEDWAAEPLTLMSAAQIGLRASNEGIIPGIPVDLDLSEGGGDNGLPASRDLATATAGLSQLLGLGQAQQMANLPSNESASSNRVHNLVERDQQGEPTLPDNRVLDEEFEEEPEECFEEDEQIFTDSDGPGTYLNTRTSPCLYDSDEDSAINGFALDLKMLEREFQDEPQVNYTGAGGDLFTEEVYNETGDAPQAGADTQDRAVFMAAAEQPEQTVGEQPVHVVDEQAVPVEAEQPVLVEEEQAAIVQAEEAIVQAANEQAEQPVPEKQPRRSARLLSRGGGKSYGQGSKRRKKSGTSGGRGREIRLDELETDIQLALDAENLVHQPLEVEDEHMVDRYCGVTAMNTAELADGIEGANASTAINAGLDDPVNLDKEESVLGAFDSSSGDDLTDDEEGAEAASQ